MNISQVANNRSHGRPGASGLVEHANRRPAYCIAAAVGTFVPIRVVVACCRRALGIHRRKLQAPELVGAGDTFDVSRKSVGPVLVAVAVRTVLEKQFGLGDDGLLNRRYGLQVAVHAVKVAVHATERLARQRHRAFMLKLLLGIAQRMGQLGGVDNTTFESGENAAMLLVKHAAPRQFRCDGCRVSARPSRSGRSSPCGESGRRCPCLRRTGMRRTPGWPRGR